MTVSGSRDEESVLACCGNAVVAWCPKSAAQQHRMLDVQHSAQVNAVGWLGKGKAVAVAGEDHVVTIYSTEAKVVATTPKAHLLPHNAPSITSLVTKGNDVVFGGHDGSIKVAKLPDLKAVSLCNEPGKPITGLALTPNGRLVAASGNGNVLMTQYDTGAAGRRPHHLNCRDTDARCSVAASAVSEQVVAGSCSGSINWWDAGTGAAGHCIQDQDMSVWLAFQHQSAHCIFSASAARTLKLWDCRHKEAAHHIGLLKPGSYVAAGPTTHEVAVGDAAGVVWLFDLRQPDAPTLRLPCNSGHAVSCIRWNTRQPVGSDARSSKRSGASPQAQQAPQGKGDVPSGLPSGPRQHRRPDVGAERSRHATPTLDVSPHRGSCSAERIADRVPSTVPENTSSSGPAAVLPSPDEALAAQASPGVHHTSISGSQGAVTIDVLQSMLSKQQAQMHKYIDAVESRLMTRISSRSGASEAPAYHTQTIKDHVDRSLSSMKDDIRGWLSDFQTEMIKQFHLAQEDIIDVDNKFTKRTDALTAAVELLRQQIQAENDNRHHVANLIRWLVSAQLVSENMETRILASKERFLEFTPRIEPFCTNSTTTTTKSCFMPKPPTVA